MNVGEQGVACKAKAGDRTFGSIRVTGAAGISYNYGSETQVNTVPHSRFNADLHGDACYSERVNAAVTQGHSQRCTFKSGHGDLVKNCLAGKRTYFRNQLKACRVP